MGGHRRGAALQQQGAGEVDTRNDDTDLTQSGGFVLSHALRPSWTAIQVEGVAISFYVQNALAVLAAVMAMMEETRV